ncbi:MAG: ABC transporter permease subunit [Candidatus Hydrogenedentes bacterium]|nr:ABC transporter permease subunit [Candidatus Hydrogenedentota bacterium]
MISRIWSAYAVEIAKAIRQRHVYLGPALVLFVVVCAPLQYSLGGEHSNGFGFVAYATSIVNVLGLILILSYSASLVSSELSSGAIRNVMVRPLYRHEFLAAKLLLGMSYALLITLTTGAASWAIAKGFGDVTAVSYGGEVIYTAYDMVRSYCLAVALALVPLSAGVAYAITVSCLTRSTAAAVTGSIGIWLVVDIVKHRLHISAFLFSSYLESPWQVFKDRCDGLDSAWFPMATHAMLASVGALLVFCAAAVAIFRRKDLHG